MRRLTYLLHGSANEADTCSCLKRNSFSKERSERFMDAEAEHKKLSWFNKIGFSCFQLAQFAEYMINTWLMFYYTTFIGMPLVTVTFLFTLSKIVGGIINPVYGYMSDRLYQTRFGKRFGRRKSMLLIGIPLKTLLFILLWIPHMSTPVYYIFFLAYFIVSPMVSTMQLTFMSEMTEDSGERAQLVAGNQIGAAFSGIIAAFASVYFFKFLGDKIWSTYFILAIVYDIVSFLLLIVFYFSVYERPVDDSTVFKEKLSIGQNLVQVFWNFMSTIKVRSYRLYLGMYLCEQMFRSLLGTINTYFIIFVLLLQSSDVAVSTSVGFIFGIGFLLFYMWLTKKTDGPFTYRVGSWGTIVVMLGMIAIAIFRPAHLAVWFVVLTIALNFGKTGVVNSTQFIFTNIPDVDEIVTGKRREGQYSGVNSTLDVIFSSIETILIGTVLAATGFAEKSSTQAPATINALLIIYTIVPIVFCLLGIILSYRFKLSVPNHKILLDEVVRLRNGGSMDDVQPKTKEVVEELTGIPYEQCWGNNNIVNLGQKKSQNESANNTHLPHPQA